MSDRTTAESPARRLWREYAQSRPAVASLMLLLTVVALALLAPWVSPQNPYDLAQLDILDAKLPPGEASATGEDPDIAGIVPGPQPEAAEL